MAPRAVSILKFVGTVSLGLLTGLSYTLSTLTVSTLLGLPQAAAASKALHSVSASAARHLSVLRNISGVAFLTAFILSPRSTRHPYLIYTAGLVFGSELVEYLPGCGTLVAAKKPSVALSKKEGKKPATSATPRGLEASYEVLGDSSSATSDGQLEEEEEGGVNGEEVRGEVEGFLKTQIIQGVISGAGFLMAVVGIWGDGV